jgi:hypothetical protein
MRIKSHVYELWLRISKRTPSREGVSVDSEETSVFLAQTPEWGSGSEVVLGNFAKTQTVGKTMQVSVSFDVKNEDGTDFAKITADYVGVSANGVANMEGLLITGFLQPLVDIAKSQAQAAA